MRGPTCYSYWIDETRINQVMANTVAGMSMTSPLFLRPVEAPRAIVLMLGPLGVSTKSLKRMANLYPHCSVVAASSPPLRFILNRSLQPTVHEILQSAQTMLSTVPTSVPIVAHAFSNGGAFLLNEIETTLLDDKRTKKVSSIDFGALRGAMSDGFQVFDSCPCYIRLIWDWKHFGYSFPHPELSRPFRWLYSLGASLSLSMWSLCTCSIRRPSRFWNNMMRSELCLNQIYLYSRRDLLSDASAVEKLVAYRMNIMKANCVVHAYDDSDHCRLHIDHPHEYAKAIETALVAMEERRKKHVASAKLQVEMVGSNGFVCR